VATRIDLLPNLVPPIAQCLRKNFLTPADSGTQNAPTGLIAWDNGGGSPRVGLPKERF
jgi:hypothetical protein